VQALCSEYPQATVDEEDRWAFGRDVRGTCGWHRRPVGDRVLLGRRNTNGRAKRRAPSADGALWLIG
jgi:hypothetical protein